MRTYYWYLTAFLRKHGRLVFGTLVVTIALFSVIVPLIASTVETKPRRYIGIVGTYSLANLPHSIQSQISLGLTRVEPDGSVEPSLSERWSVEEDGKTYRFIIRGGLVWQDGQPFVPTDINYNFIDVQTITTQNDVVFKLPDTYVPFPTVVSQPLFRTGTRRKWFFFTEPTLVGLGDYKVLSFQEQGGRVKQLVLDSVTDRIIYRFYLTEADAITGFKHGEVDSLPEMTSTYDLTDWPTATVSEKLHTNRYLGVFFNNNNPLFKKNVRQSLNYILPKPTGAEQVTSPISPDSWAFLPGGKTYDLDKPRAVERMLDSLPDAPLRFTLRTTQSFAQDAEEIKRIWEAFGSELKQSCDQDSSIKEKALCQNLEIGVEIRIDTFPDTNDFEVLLLAQDIFADPDQYALWHSDQPANFTGYKNTRIDKLLEEGRTTTDRQERTAIYQEFQQFFLEDSPVIFLRYLTSYQIDRT